MMQLQFRLGLISDYVIHSLAVFKLPVFPGCQLSLQQLTLMGRLTAHYQLTISYMHQLYRSFLRVGLIVHTYTTYSYLVLICLTLKTYHYLRRPWYVINLLLLHLTTTTYIHNQNSNFYMEPLINVYSSQSNVSCTIFVFICLSKCQRLFILLCKELFYYNFSKAQYNYLILVFYILDARQI